MGTSEHRVSVPYLWESQTLDLSLDSTLQDLPLYDFQALSTCSGREITPLLDKYPLVPGVILVEPEPDSTPEFLGMVSRRRLLEFFLRPHGLELFLHQPLQVLYSYTRIKLLILPANTPILTAAQQAFKRSPEQFAEPIVVRGNWQNPLDYPWFVSYRLLDIHDLNIAYWQIRGIETQVRYEKTQAQMIQSEKMASLGRLVDGVAHEILDPVGFIWGNLTYLSEYSQNLLELLSSYEKHYPQPPQLLLDLQEELELDFLREDFPRVLTSMRSGTERLSKLATSLQNFCHIDEVHPRPADLHNCLDSILLLLKSQLSTEIKIVKNYGHLPPVNCYQGQLNQVFMNILTHGIDGLLNQAAQQDWVDQFRSSENVGASQQPQITITTKMLCPQVNESNPRVSQQRWVSICIADNSPGLSPEQHQKILDSFSIKKRSEKETSLSVSYHIITAKHGGKLKLRTQPNIGTEFEILLPLI